jgi:hypothetical protein
MNWENFTKTYGFSRIYQGTLVLRFLKSKSILATILQNIREYSNLSVYTIVT